MENSHRCVTEQADHLEADLIECCWSIRNHPEWSRGRWGLLPNVTGGITNEPGGLNIRRDVKSKQALCSAAPGLSGHMQSLLDALCSHPCCCPGGCPLVPQPDFGDCRALQLQNNATYTLKRRARTSYKRGFACSSRKCSG